MTHAKFEKKKREGKGRDFKYSKWLLGSHTLANYKTWKLSLFQNIFA